MPIFARLNSPTGLALIEHAPGSTYHATLFVADTKNHVVRSIEIPTGPGSGLVIATVAGMPGSPGKYGDGGVATSAYLNHPNGLTADAIGQKLYIADAENHAVRLLDLSSGILTTVAGILGSKGWHGDGDPALRAHLYFPYALALGLGNYSRLLYIADNWNHAVRVLDLETGRLDTAAGVLGFHGRTGDGGRSILARLHSPMGLATHHGMPGDVYVADTLNHVVRLVSRTSDVRDLLTESNG
eukprot:gnl/TRDRNA2_/TRDRNA2_199915_c0_seq1.p1 gnl/TRDRNA2_/TRDRNA2_199915_c0~~gnl/TRDRNA2_/TRDRNA2_199915_c0_seq1.p1  ORF type:complete len:242 (+),score=25.32 gnl/TRDRNA2_/TRDRNA2_199915_c0_seq1:3-728(+)